MGNCFSGGATREAPSARATCAGQQPDQLGVKDRVLHPVIQSPTGALQVAVSQARYAAAPGADPSPLLVKQTPGGNAFIALFEGLGQEGRAVAAFCRSKVFEVCHLPLPRAAQPAAVLSRPAPQIEPLSLPLLAPACTPPAAVPRVQRAPRGRPAGRPQGDGCPPGRCHLCRRPPATRGECPSACTAACRAAASVFLRHPAMLLGNHSLLSRAARRVHRMHPGWPPPHLRRFCTCPPASLIRRAALSPAESVHAALPHSRLPHPPPLQAKSRSGASCVLMLLDLGSGRAYCANIGAAHCLLSRIEGSFNAKQPQGFFLSSEHITR